MNFNKFQSVSSLNFLKKNSGFTLVEILLVLGVLAIIGSIGLVSFSSFRARQALDLGTAEIVNTLRRAQSAARNQEQNSAWGVYFQNPASGLETFVLFSGNSYATGTVSFARKLAFGVDFSDPAASSTKEILFAQITGLPNATATIVLVLKSDASATKTITINSQGEVSY